MQKGKPAKKYSQAGRLHAVIRLLETRNGLTLDELAEECGIDRRTVHRDMNAICEAGYPLVSEWLDGKKIYRFITKSRSIPPITFTLNQLMSLYLLRSLGGLFTGTPFQTEIEELFKTITSALPERYAAHLERIARVSLPLLHGARDYSGVTDQIEGLQKALLHQYRVVLSYSKKKSSDIEIYEFDPYTLIFHKGGIYILGYAHNRNDLRLFALERVRGVEVSKHRFSIPDGFQPEEHFNQSFGLVNDTPMEVKLSFSSNVAHTVVNRNWMPNQVVSKDSHGRTILSFTATGKMELTSWILSFGMNAEVLEPPALRKEVKQQIKEMRELYRNKNK